MRILGAVFFGALCFLSLPYAGLSMMILDTPAAAEPPGVFLAYLMIIASWLLSLSLGGACLALLRGQPGWQIAAVLPLFPFAAMALAGFWLGIL